jgi:hypothetical protein
MKEGWRENHHILLEVTKIEECNNRYILYTSFGSIFVFSKCYYSLEKYKKKLKLKDNKGLKIMIENTQN